MRLDLALALAALLLAGTPARAFDTRTVTVQDVRAPELKTYRVMRAGLDAFDANHALAPDAPELRFRLHPLSRAAEAGQPALKLRISLDASSIPVPLAPDDSFVLPRDARAEMENGDLVLNRKKGTWRWQPAVFSTGVPPNMRRLGDLRLECRVLVAVMKAERTFWERALVNTALLSSDWCGVENITTATATTRTLRSAQLLVGEARIPLPLSRSGTSFQSPIGNRAYSDNTLIALEVEDDPD